MWTSKICSGEERIVTVFAEIRFKGPIISAPISAPSTTKCAPPMFRSKDSCTVSGVFWVALPQFAHTLHLGPCAYMIKPKEPHDQCPKSHSSLNSISIKPSQMPSFVHLLQLTFHRPHEASPAKVETTPAVEIPLQAASTAHSPLSQRPSSPKTPAASRPGRKRRYEYLPEDGSYPS